ncbi:LysR family transcriptional regulator [Glutamicibacter sp.]|uniref:LysR family transcriptional regulator n=1 Tax=Glutamicibacter sp. TaxID=1931995 RepID=UPI0028BD3F27|nr:LysR family transcriptional regulator [Glutamicibacter sp.]
MQTLPTALKYFHEVATTGSITEAARAEHVTASAISRQITALERQIGSAVFLRHARGMELTDAGVLLLAHTRRTIAEGEQLAQDLSALALGPGQTIEVASSEGLAAYATSRAVALFCAQYPQTSVHLRVLPSAEAAVRVVEGTADLATVFALGPQRDVNVEFSTPAPAYAVVSVDHPLATRPRVSLDEVCDYPLCMPARGITQRELFDIATAMAGLKPRIALSTDHVNPAVEFARSGVGVTLLSKHSRRRDVDESLVYLSIEHPVLSERTAQVLTMPRRRRSALVSALIELIIAQLGSEQE